MEIIKDRLSADLKNAMKAKDLVAVKTIRILISALDNAGAVTVDAPKAMPISGGIAGATSGLGSTEVSRKELSNKDIKQIIQKEIAEAENAIEVINDNSRPETEELLEQVNILRRYL